MACQLMALIIMWWALFMVQEKNIFEPLTFNDSRIIIMVQKRNKEDHYVPTIR
ncbi:hypothetical protein HMPREF3033_00416 [Veillonellaceae bacterium DNF00751]|nr:hypothetical protein HMPREF3033_00416 [Veillonellaceae bacterium DNF00751]